MPTKLNNCSSIYSSYKIFSCVNLRSRCKFLHINATYFLAYLCYLFVIVNDRDCKLASKKQVHEITASCCYPLQTNSYKVMAERIISGIHAVHKIPRDAIAYMYLKNVF